VVSSADLQRFYGVNGVFPGSVLVDGFVAGLWRLARTKGTKGNKGTATLTIELFGRVPDRDLVAREADRMLAFCAPHASHAIRFARG
jgi:hypothetical protein